MPPPLLSLKEVATYTSLSVKTIRRAIEAGDLPASRLGRQLRVDKVDLEGWILGCCVRPDRLREHVRRSSGTQERARLEGEVAR